MLITTATGYHMAKAPGPSIGDILGIADKIPDKRRKSTLHLWMRENVAGIEKALRTGRHGWRSLSEALAEAGLRDGRGDPPSLRRCQETFAAVRREKELASNNKGSGTPAKSLGGNRENIAHGPTFRPATIRGEATGVLPPRAPLKRVE